MVLGSYERKDSPFVWIQYGVTTAERQRQKTAILKSDPQKKRKIAAELNRIEAQLIPLLDKGSTPRGNWSWVSDFIATRYANRPRTCEIYLIQWRWLRDFMDMHELRAPAMLTRERVFEYPAWRCSAVKQKSRRSPKLNTAIGELKLLGLIMDEAVARKLVPENPARKLRIAREETEMRPEISDAEIGTIRRELTKEVEHADWMKKSFELALHTGLRFASTRLRRSQIRSTTDDILIEKPKGGRRRAFTIPIYDSIRPLIESFLGSGDDFTWTAPRGTLTGLIWNKFFKRIGLPRLCFHSTRVTFISRGMRAGIPEAVMMRMVNHASKQISRIYQRWTDDDVRQYADRVLIPSGDASPTQNLQKRLSCRDKAASPTNARPNKRYRHKPTTRQA